MCDTAAGVCRAGGHPHTSSAAICAYHLETGRAHLRALPRLVQDLAQHLIPGPPVAGDKVTSKAVGSPTPGRLDILTLIGPGCSEIRRDSRALVPQVRRWSTVETVTVAAPHGHAGRVDTVRKQVRVWHRELVVDHHGRPLLVVDDDQTGVVPPAEWADVWVRRWRHELGHRVPARTKGAVLGRLANRTAPLIMPAHPAAAAVAEDSAGRLLDAAVAEATLMARGQPQLLPAVAAYVTIQREYIRVRHLARARITAAMVGQADDGARTRARDETGTTGRTPGDTLAAEWGLRYGTAVVAARVAVDTGYLSQWLAEAAGHDDAGVGEFLVELRALVAELEHALGETRDEQWLGRCPAELRDDNGDPAGRVCGYGLWQDPYRTRVECPRCHTVWPEIDWLPLAARIRAKWPIDRRRLYTYGDRKAAEKQVDRLPRCRGCERVMSVRWKPVGGHRGEPVWRPTALVCQSGCLAGATAAAA